MTSQRWKHRPLGSNWGEFGSDDRLGRLNLLTSEKVRQGAAEVKVGESFCLSIALDLPGGSALNANRLPPVVRPTLRNGEVNFNCEMRQFDASCTDVLSDDLAVLHLQYSTQWDSFAHAGQLPGGAFPARPTSHSDGRRAVFRRGGEGDDPQLEEQYFCLAPGHIDRSQRRADLWRLARPGFGGP